MNTDKTEAIVIGGDLIEDHSLGIKWVNDNDKLFKTLGVWFAINKNTMLKKNLEDKLVKMSNLIGMWSARNLSLKGKIVVLKSVIMSIIVNIITIIYIPNWFLENTDKLFFQFL